MTSLDVGAFEIALGVGLFAAGFGVAVLTVGADRRTRARLRTLEQDLGREREARERYADAVAKHFDRTSDLFRDLTSQYTSLYAHLAEGARELCADRLPVLGTRFGAPVLGAGPVEGTGSVEGAGSVEETGPVAEPRAVAETGAVEGTGGRTRDPETFPTDSAAGPVGEEEAVEPPPPPEDRPGDEVRPPGGAPHA